MATMSTEGAAARAGAPRGAPPRQDRRARRRQETIAEILDIAQNPQIAERERADLAWWVTQVRMALDTTAPRTPPRSRGAELTKTCI